MSKQAQATSKPATRKAPAKGGALAQAAQVLAQAPAAPAQAPAAPAQAPKPSLPRGCPGKVRLGATAYKSKAAHTVARWQAITQACAAGGGVADVLALVAQCGPGANAHNYDGPGVPGHFITYCLRRGYLLAVA